MLSINDIQFQINIIYLINHYYVIVSFGDEACWSYHLVKKDRNE